MPGKDKKKVDIEALVQWAFLDELSKRQISSAEGIWDRLAQYGSLGGVDPDPGHGAAQRYAHFGLPHRDAELIEAEVGRLGMTAIDWRADFEKIAGDLAGLVSINDVSVRTRHGGTADASSGWGRSQLERTDLTVRRNGARARPANDRPRDVILVQSFNVTSLIIRHAVWRSRPDWRTEQMRPVPTVAQRGRQDLAQIIGRRLAKNIYTEGSYCPLIWTPSPIEVVLARADYFVWRQGLVRLTALDLSEHEAMPPAAPPLPWFENGEMPRRTYAQVNRLQGILPLKPARRRVATPPKKPRHSRVRSIAFD